MSLRLVTPATAFPISLAEAKTHLAVDRADHDAMITALIAAAVAAVEKSTGRLFAPATWEMVLDAFPAAEIHIPAGPVTGVASVTYADADGVAQVVDPADYEVDTASADGWVVPVAGAVWPATMATINAVAVTFTVGGSMPVDVRQAVLLLLGLWYDNRAAATAAPMTEVPLATESLLHLHRRYYV